MYEVKVSSTVEKAVLVETMLSVYGTVMVEVDTTTPARVVLVSS
jgi:hypothetical protein